MKFRYNFHIKQPIFLVWKDNGAMPSPPNRTKNGDKLLFFALIVIADSPYANVYP